MAEKRDLYEILQVSPLADPEVIVVAFRRLALKYHPDHDPSSAATTRMQVLNDAYAILNDPEKRAAYDRARASPQSPPAAQQRSSPPAATPPQQQPRPAPSSPPPKQEPSASPPPPSPSGAAPRPAGPRPSPARSAPEAPRRRRSSRGPSMLPFVPLVGGGLIVASCAWLCSSREPRAAVTREPEQRPVTQTINTAAVTAVPMTRDVGSPPAGSAVRKRTPPLPRASSASAGARRSHEQAGVPAIVEPPPPIPTSLEVAAAETAEAGRLRPSLPAPMRPVPEPLAPSQLLPDRAKVR
jgi:hypothetical protein